MNNKMIFCTGYCQNFACHKKLESYIVIMAKKTNQGIKLDDLSGDCKNYIKVKQVG